MSWSFYVQWVQFRYVWSRKVISIIRNFLWLLLFAPASHARLHYRYIYFLKSESRLTKKAEANKCLQTMYSKKTSTLFIITHHIFSHFAKTFNRHKVYWLYLTLVTWISLAVYCVQSVHWHSDVWVKVWSHDRDGSENKLKL